MAEHRDRRFGDAAVPPQGPNIIPREAANEDQVMEVALEAGAEDFKAEPEGYEVITGRLISRPCTSRSKPRHQAAVAVVTELASITVSLPNDQAVAAVNKLIDALEDHDDVKEVYSNAELPD